MKRINNGAARAGSRKAITPSAIATLAKKSNLFPAHRLNEGMSEIRE
jgi:hypothetical protein